MTAAQTHIVFLRLKEQKTNGNLQQSALRGLFTVSVNDNWRKITCQSVVAAYAVREHISSHLWPTQLCCQNGMELVFVGEVNEKRRQQPLANRARNAELLPDHDRTIDNSCSPSEVLPLFWRSMTRTSCHLDCLGISSDDPKECSHQMCAPSLVQFVSSAVFPTGGKPQWML